MNLFFVHKEDYRQCRKMRQILFIILRTIVSFTTSFMPHFGQRPGSSLSTSECTLQVYIAKWFKLFF